MRDTLQGMMAWRATSPPITAVIATLVAALSLTAEAALPPETFRIWANEATAHLQAEVLAMTPGREARTRCDTVLGVRRVFRDASGTVRADSRIRLDIPCFREPLPSERPIPSMPGPDVWIAQDALRPGKFVELFVSGSGDKWELRSGGLVHPIDGPSDTPRH